MAFLRAGLSLINSVKPSLLIGIPTKRSPVSWLILKLSAKPKRLSIIFVCFWSPREYFQMALRSNSEYKIEFVLGMKAIPLGKAILSRRTYAFSDLMSYFIICPALWLSRNIFDAKSKGMGPASVMYKIWFSLSMAMLLIFPTFTPSSLTCSNFLEERSTLNSPLVAA